MFWRIHVWSWTIAEHFLYVAGYFLLCRSMLYLLQGTCCILRDTSCMSRDTFCILQDVFRMSQDTGCLSQDKFGVTRLAASFEIFEKVSRTPSKYLHLHRSVSISKEVSPFPRNYF